MRTCRARTRIMRTCGIMKEQGPPRKLEWRISGVSSNLVELHRRRYSHARTAASRSGLTQKEQATRISIALPFEPHRA
jgi:hypothetical protein